MTSSARILCATVLIAAGVAMFAPSPGASSEHFIITNNNYFDAQNSGTILKLGGTRANPTLTATQTLATAVISDGNEATPSVQIVSKGSQACVFLGDTEIAGNAISAFKFPGLQLVGSYSDFNVPSSASGLAVVTHGDFLYAAFSGYNNSNFVDSWTINPDCSLSLLHTISLLNALDSLAVTPDGNTLVGGYTNEGGIVDSFSIGSSGSLAELGPFGEQVAIGANGMDITGDGKYAIFMLSAYGGEGDQNTQIEVFSINPNGTLGSQQVWGGDGELGPGWGAGASVRLSPDGTFLYADSEESHGGIQVTTLDLSENPFELTYNGCITTLKLPQGEPPTVPGDMATVVPSGAGGGLYVSEYSNFGTIGLLSVDSKSGCTTEVAGSPYIVTTNGGLLNSLVAWPPRPF